MIVSMYGRCGDLLCTQIVFDELPFRNLHSWRTLIACYTKHGHAHKALGCYCRMQMEGQCPDVVIYTCILKACGILQDVDFGKQVHDQITSQKLLERDHLLGTALVDMYAKCGALTKAQQAFDRLPVQSVSSWSALIVGYGRHGQGKEALSCYGRMRRDGFLPDAITYICTLKACSITQDINMGTKIHNEIVRQGLLKANVILGTALVDVYAKSGVLVKAHNVFDELVIRDVTAWNALITGYIQSRHGREAIDCFHQMQRESQSPDEITYACVLKACSITQDIGLGKKIHYEIVRQGLLKRCVMLQSALVDMYAKLGELKEAQNVLSELPFRDAASWNALITGYVQHGHGKEALGCFRCMQKEGISPGSITYACILKACGIIQDVKKGKMIHDEIVSQGLLGQNAILGSAVVDMYVKCGVLAKAQTVLDELPVQSVSSWSALVAGYAQQGQVQEALDCFLCMQSKGFSANVASWNALMGGYAQKGLAEEALDCFQSMQGEGVSPDAITFVHLLHACSQSGLVDEGQIYFNSMKENYGLMPNEEHYTCMVDLYGRSRLVIKALQLIMIMPSLDFPAVWSALLGDYRKWGSIEVGRLAFDQLIELDECNSASYVFMSNIYAATRMREGAQKIECMWGEDAAMK